VTAEKKSQPPQFANTHVLNESIEEDAPLNTVSHVERDMQQHKSLKASHQLRASLQGKEPEDFLKLVKEGLG